MKNIFNNNKKVVILLMIFILLTIGVKVFDILILNPNITFVSYYKPILLITLLYPIIRIILKYSYLLVHYVLCTPYSWTKETERPRILFNVIGLAFVYVSFKIIHTEETDSILFWSTISVAYLFLFTGILAMSFTWSKKFEQNLIPSAKAKLEDLNPVKSLLHSFEKELIEKIRYTLTQNKWLQGDQQTLSTLLTYNGNVSKMHELEIQSTDQLEWILDKGLNNNQSFNSQTLISFISNLYNTENNYTITLIISKLFKQTYHISSKNLSTWKINKSKYLKEFETEIKHFIIDRK